MIKLRSRAARPVRTQNRTRPHGCLPIQGTTTPLLFVITPKRVPNTRRGTELTAQTLSVKGTSTMANFVLPYEPDDVRHIDEEKRRREIKEWLQQLRCEVSVVSPSIVPEVHDRRR